MVSWCRAAGAVLGAIVVTGLLPLGVANAAPAAESRPVVAVTPAASSPAARFVSAGLTRLFDTRSGGIVPAGKVAPTGR